MAAPVDDAREFDWRLGRLFIPMLKRMHPKLHLLGLKEKAKALL